MLVRYTVILTDEVKARLHALPLALRREITILKCLLDNKTFLGPVPDPS